MQLSTRHRPRSQGGDRSLRRSGHAALAAICLAVPAPVATAADPDPQTGFAAVAKPLTELAAPAPDDPFGEPVPDSVLAGTVGGLRIDGLDIGLFISARTHVNGELIEEVTRAALPELRGRDVSGTDATSVSQRVSDGSLVFLLQNTANDVVIQRDVRIEVEVGGFSDTFGTAAERGTEAMLTRIADLQLGL